MIIPDLYLVLYLYFNTEHPMIPTSTSHIRIYVERLQNISGQSEIDLLCSGFIIDITTDLARFRTFRVISGLDVKDRPDHLDYIVNGIARYRGNRIQINLQLLNGIDNRVVWAEKFEGELEELFRIEADAINKIVVSLQQSVEYDLIAQIRQRQLKNLSAYENWLYGMEELRKGTAEADQVARGYFENAIQMDPGFARAYTGMSLTYFNEWSCLLWDDWEFNQRASIEWALKALELDSFDPTNAMILGKTYLFFRQFDKAEHYLRQALKMNPGDPKNLASIAFCMAFLGEVDESIELYEQAKRIDPSQQGFIVTGAFTYFEAGRFEEAVSIGQGLPARSGWIDFQGTMAAAYFHLEQKDRMWSCWKEYVDYFTEKIRPGESPNEQLALEWMIQINPYQKGTQHEPFWTFMAEQLGTALTDIGQGISQNSGLSNQIELSGEIWTLSYMGQTGQVSNLKGMYDLVTLLSEPNKDFHCADLAGVTTMEKGTEMLDAKAIDSYKQRMSELQQSIQEAETLQQSDRLERLRIEYDALIDHLSQSVTIQGKPRVQSDTLNKARSAVTWRIRSAIKKIKAVHPQLALHLNRSIHTGTYCSYRPEVETRWLV